MNTIDYPLICDLHSSGICGHIKLKNDGLLSRKLVVHFTDYGKSYDISGCHAVFRAKKPDSTYLYNDCEIVNNAVEYVLTPQTLAVSGLVEGEISLYSPLNRVIVSPTFHLEIEQSVVSDSEAESTSEYLQLKNLLTTLSDRTAIGFCGHRDAVSDLESIEEPTPGDQVWVGLTEPYTLYVYGDNDGTMEWFSLGNTFRGLDGENGTNGVAGPNSLSSTTTTALSGILKGNGTNISLAAEGIDYAGADHAAPNAVYGLSSATNYGHAKASSTSPSALGIASAGTETASFARGDHVHPKPAPSDIGAASRFTGSAELSTNWTGDSAPYTQTMTLTGILETDSPHVVPVYSSTYATALLEEAAAACISSVKASAENTLVFTCLHDKPTQALTVSVECVR